MAESAKDFVKRQSLSGSGKALVKMEELLWRNISVLKMERPLRQSLCERRKVFVKKTNDFWKGKWSRRKAFGRKVWFHFYYRVFCCTCKTGCFVWTSSKGWGGWPKQFKSPHITCNAHWHVGSWVASHDSSQALKILSICCTLVFGYYFKIWHN